MKQPIKHIIFDLKGVLFDYPATDWQHLINNEPNKNPFIPLPGLQILKDSYKKLHGTGQTFYILSNFKPERFALLRKLYPEVFGLFDGIVISGSSGYAKPDERIFHHLFNTYGLIPEECVFIDDAPGNITAAQKLGVTAILCDNFNQLKSEFKKLKLL